ncbi:MAG TPA: thioredoxin [Flavobacteriia bacterium]|nr:thioredoxin [Flavobacteriia bacterium]
MQYNTIKNQTELDQILNTNLGVLLYFSRQTCNVGEALEPKVIKLLEDKFPKIPFYYVDMDQTPDVAAKYSVFVEPTIIVAFDGKETIRKSRIISIPELEDTIQRIYNIAF